LSALRGVWLLTVTGVGLLAGLARAEDFEAGKSAAKIFDSDCVTCHRSPRGLARGMGSRALVDFLREHYTTGLGPANELANYLQSGTADADNRHAPRPTADQPHAGDPHERSQTTAPSDVDADQSAPVRKHRHAASTPEPATTSEHDETPPQAHKRHHAHTSEPTDNAAAPANARPAASADVQAGPDETPPHKRQRSPRGGESAPSAKQRPDMTPTGATGPVGGISEPSTGASAAHGGEPDRAPSAPARVNHEGPAEAAEPGSNAGPSSSTTIRTSETGGAQTSEPPSATGSGDQPTFSAPSP
jgi:hypothetical protein